MALQTVINGSQCLGIVGEFSDASPKSGRAYVVYGKDGSTGTAKPTFGKFFSFTAGPLSTGTSTQTVFAKQGISASTNTMGILVNPKEHFTNGFTTALTCENGESATVATVGHIWVKSATATTAGAPVYIDASGNIGIQAGLTSPTFIFGAKWLRTTDYPAFSATSTYNVGDKVIQSNKVYRCKTAITTAAAWDSDKWDAIEVISEIAISNPLLKGEAGAGSL